MNYDGTAYFVFRPRRLCELRRPHSLEKEHPYQIIKELTLPPIDFENFSEDLLADRSFLDSFQGPQSKNGVYRCIMICSPHIDEEILVVPNDGFVQLAAVRVSLGKKKTNHTGRVT